jgi:hypothetical protein
MTAGLADGAAKSWDLSEAELKMICFSVPPQPISYVLRIKVFETVYLGEPVGLGELDGLELADADADADALAVAVALADALAEGDGLDAVTTIVALLALLVIGAEATGNETFLVMAAVIPIFLS